MCVHVCARARLRVRARLRERVVCVLRVVVCVRLCVCVRVCGWTDMVWFCPPDSTVSLSPRKPQSGRSSVH